jgi:uncharacterized protein YjbI with pentapeptide repeats
MSETAIAEIRQTRQKKDTNDADLSGSSFANINLSGSAFNDVKLIGLQSPIPACRRFALKMRTFLAFKSAGRTLLA